MAQPRPGGFPGSFGAAPFQPFGAFSALQSVFYDPFFHDPFVNDPFFRRPLGGFFDDFFQGQPMRQGAQFMEQRAGSQQQGQQVLRIEEMDHEEDEDAHREPWYPSGQEPVIEHPDSDMEDEEPPLYPPGYSPEGGPSRMPSHGAPGSSGHDDQLRTGGAAGSWRGGRGDATGGEGHGYETRGAYGSGYSGVGGSGAGRRGVRQIPIQGAESSSYSSQMQSSSSSYGRGGGYTMSTSRRSGPGGVEEVEETTVQDGVEKRCVTRTINGRGVTTTTTRRPGGGQEDTYQTLHNLDEEGLASFTRQWEQYGRPRLVGSASSQSHSQSQGGVLMSSSAQQGPGRGWQSQSSWRR